MNIEIANRLVNLRKSNNLSQEALAEKLGISRQAVSKWERAEASPDTDNLIMLARLYGVSLDELLKTEEEIPPAADVIEPVEKNQEVSAAEEGVHLKDKDGSEVHIGWNGIQVDNNEAQQESVHDDKKGVRVDNWSHFPFAIFITLLYIILGVFFFAWHPGWMLFLLIPLWHSFVGAVKHGNPNIFAYPVLATLLFLAGGFFWGIWHPGWIIFLTVPLYYTLTAYIQHLRKEGE